MTILKKAPRKSTITFDRSIELPVNTQRTQRNGMDDTDNKDTIENPEITKLKKEEKVFQVSIQKRDNGLGLSLAGGKDSDICYDGKLFIIHMNISFEEVQFIETNPYFTLTCIQFLVYNRQWKRGKRVME